MAQTCRQGVSFSLILPGAQESKGLHKGSAGPRCVWFQLVWCIIHSEEKEGGSSAPGEAVALCTPPHFLLQNVLLLPVTPCKLPLSSALCLALVGGSFGAISSRSTTAILKTCPQLTWWLLGGGRMVISKIHIFLESYVQQIDR